jgi:hypothetical protein
MRSKLTKHAVLIAFYALLALIVLYNPIFHSATHVPGDATAATDYYHFHWNYWWIRHALTNGLNVYQTDYVFAPFTSSLVYHTLTPSYFPIWALLEPLFGTVIAMTTIVALIFTLTGYLFYLLLRHEGVATPLALAFGAILEVSPLMFSGLYWTNINVMSWFWLPALMLIWGRIVQSERELRTLWTIILALALWGMLLTDLQYPLFAFFVVLPYALWTLRYAKRPLPLIMHGLIAGGLALGLLWVAGPLPYILSTSREGFSPTPVERAARVPFPYGFFTRIQYGASPGSLVIPTLVIGVLVSVRRRIGKSLHWSAPPLFWIAIAIPPLLLSAGASITIAGIEVPMPYLALHNLLGGMFRYPERFAAVFTIPALIAAGQLLTRAYPTLRRPKVGLPVGVALTLLVAAEARIFLPQPLQPLPTPYSFHQAMAREPYQYVVVDVPTAGSSGEGYVGDPRWMTTEFYALAHDKRVVNGHISRVNTWNYMYMETSDPMMAWLGQRRYLEPETVEAQLRERIFSWPIGYIVIHQDYIGREGPTLQEIIGFFNRLDDLLCFYTQEGDALVYRTAWHPDGCDLLTRTPPETSSGVYEVDIGSAGDERYIGWGYHPQEQVAGLTLRWTGEYPQTDTYVDLPLGSYTLTATLQAFWENRRISLRVNGVEVGEAVDVGTDGLADYRWRIPAEMIGDGQHLQVTLAYDDVIVPVEVGQSADQRRLAVAVERLRFTRE